MPCYCYFEAFATARTTRTTAKARDTTRPNTRHLQLSLRAVTQLRGRQRRRHGMTYKIRYREWLPFFLSTNIPRVRRRHVIASSLAPWRPRHNNTMNKSNAKMRRRRRDKAPKHAP